MPKGKLLIKAKRGAARKAAKERKKALDRLVSRVIDAENEAERDRKDNEYIKNLAGNSKTVKSRPKGGVVLGGQGQTKKKGSHNS